MAEADETLRIVSQLVDQTSAPLKRIQGELTKTQRVGQTVGTVVSRGFTGIGSAIGKALGPLAALAAGFTAVRSIGGVTRSAFEFGEAMSEVSTIVDTTTVNMAALERAVLDIAKATGSNEVETAKALYQAISSGAQAGKQAIDLLNTSARLSVAGLTSIEDSVDLLSTSVNAYRASNLTAERAADILFKTVERGKTTIGELTSNLGKLLPTAAAFGVSMEQASAAVAALTLAGLGTDEATTGLRGAIDALSRTTEESAKLLDAAGLSFSAAEVEAKGLVRTLLDVQRAFGGNISAIKTLFPEIRSFNVVAALLSDGGALLNDILLDLETSAGALALAFDKRIGTATKRLQILFNALRIEIVDRAGKAIIETVDAMAARLGGFNKLQESAKIAAEVLTGVFKVFAASVGGALSTFQALVAELGGADAVANGVRGAFEVIAAAAAAAFDVIQLGFTEFINNVRALPDLVRAIRNEVTPGLFAVDIGDLRTQLAQAERELASAQARMRERLADVDFFNMPDLRAPLAGTLVRRQVEDTQARVDEIRAQIRARQLDINEVLANLDAVAKNTERNQEQFAERIRTIWADIRAVFHEGASGAADSAKQIAEAFDASIGPRIQTSLTEIGEGVDRGSRSAINAAREAKEAADAATESTRRQAEQTARNAELAATNAAAIANNSRTGFGIMTEAVSGFSGALAEVALGFRKSSDAFGEFADRFLLRLAQMAFEILAFRTLVATVSAFSQSAGDGLRNALVQFGVAGLGSAAAGAASPSGGIPSGGLDLPFTAIAPPSGRFAAAGAGGQTIVENNFTIHAVDAASFRALLARDAGAVADAALSASRRSPRVRKGFGLRGRA